MEVRLCVESEVNQSDDQPEETENVLGCEKYGRYLAHIPRLGVF